MHKALICIDLCVHTMAVYASVHISVDMSFHLCLCEHTHPSVPVSLLVFNFKYCFTLSEKLSI